MYTPIVGWACLPTSFLNLVKQVGFVGIVKKAIANHKLTEHVMLSHATS
jgi:hypothetical protein